MAERNVYVVPEDRWVIRTADVYQTETEVGTSKYSDKLCEVVATFSNGGAPQNYNACCMVGKSKREEIAMRLYAVVDPDTERFTEVGFKSKGCLAMTACSSMIAQMLEGKSFDESLAIRADDLREALGGVPWDRSHTVEFAIEGVRALIGDYIIRKEANVGMLDKVVSCNSYDLKCLATEHCSLRDARVELKLGYAEEGSA